VAIGGHYCFSSGELQSTSPNISQQNSVLYDQDIVSHDRSITPSRALTDGSRALNIIAQKIRTGNLEGVGAHLQGEQANLRETVDIWQQRITNTRTHMAEAVTLEADLKKISEKQRNREDQIEVVTSLSLKNRNYSQLLKQCEKIEDPVEREEIKLYVQREQAYMLCDLDHFGQLSTFNTIQQKCLCSLYSVYIIFREMQQLREGGGENPQNIQLLIAKYMPSLRDLLKQIRDLYEQQSNLPVSCDKNLMDIVNFLSPLLQQVVIGAPFSLSSIMQYMKNHRDIIIVTTIICFIVAIFVLMVVMVLMVVSPIVIMLVSLLLFFLCGVAVATIWVVCHFLSTMHTRHSAGDHSRLLSLKAR